MAASIEECTLRFKREFSSLTFDSGFLLSLYCRIYLDRDGIEYRPS